MKPNHVSHRRFTRLASGLFAAGLILTLTTVARAQTPPTGLADTDSGPQAYDVAIDTSPYVLRAKKDASSNITLFFVENGTEYALPANGFQPFALDTAVSADGQYAFVILQTWPQASFVGMPTAGIDVYALAIPVASPTQAIAYTLAGTNNVFANDHALTASGINVYTEDRVSLILPTVTDANAGAPSVCNKLTFDEGSASWSAAPGACIAALDAGAPCTPPASVPDSGQYDPVSGTCQGGTPWPCPAGMVYSPEDGLPTEHCDNPPSDGDGSGGGTTTATCGNGVCETGEDATSCPSDCSGDAGMGATCGNGICEAGEDSASCPSDCWSMPGACGDGWCDPSSETAANCPNDCFCGNGTCDPGEDAASCPAECF